MSNATDLVRKRLVRRVDESFRAYLEVHAAALDYWRGAMIGLDATGYLCKFDDAQSAIFMGIADPLEGKLEVPISAVGTYELHITRPQFFELAVSGVAVTDIGKKVYASDDQTGVMTNGGTYGNLVGRIVAVAASGIALIEPNYDGIAGHSRMGASRTMAATGAQSLTKYDLNKTILLPNTGAYALTLPAVASTQAGDRLRFVKTTADAAAVTLTGNASETIDNSNTLATIDARYDCAELVSTGSEWVVQNRDIA